MKFFIINLLLCVTSTLFAAENLDSDRWELYQAKIYFENDLFGDFTDGEYTSGEKFNLLYHVGNSDLALSPFLFSSGKPENTFVSFSLANQIYTPIDIIQTELIEDDRPYAGWTYFEIGVHKSTAESLNSVIIKVGVIGSLSYSEEIQTGMHELLNIGLPMGWDNQLENELGVNLTWLYKWRYAPKAVDGWLESAFIPFVQADLGNISTAATLGGTMRLGYNIAKDFGVTSIGLGGESTIPVYELNEKSLEKNWSFSLNFSLMGSAVARDIFLDGNTFQESHSVQKNPFVVYVSAGISMRYKRLSLDYMNTRNSKKGDKEGALQDVGTVILTWQF